ncbi:MAG: hypothetical protein NC452_08545 [Eubacterium sp.]|nr:hypothetical protein [Eubacterium sp.]
MENFVHLVTDFVGDFLSNEDNSANVGKWLGGAMTKFMPEMSADEANSASDIIVNTVKSLNAKIQAVQQADSAEKWFRDEFNSQTETLSPAEKGKILSQAFNGFAEAESGFTGEPAEAAGGIADNAWDNFSLLQMSTDVMKKAGEAALYSLAGSAGEVVKQGIEGVVSVEGAAEALASSVGTAADTGVKCAASGAALIAHKKGWFKKFLPVDASVQEIANIAVGAVENVKTFFAVGKGLCSTEEAIDRVQRTVVARAVDFLAVNSPAIGTSIGAIFGPTGAAIGNAIGNGISFLAKTDAREFFVKGLNKVATAARTVVSKAKDKLKAGLNKIKVSLFG